MTDRLADRKTDTERNGFDIREGQADRERDWLADRKIDGHRQ